MQDPKEILEKVSRKLPVFTQTVSGGKKDILLFILFFFSVECLAFRAEKVLCTATAQLSVHSYCAAFCAPLALQAQVIMQATMMERMAD